MTKTQKRLDVKKLVLSGVFLAVALLLPFLTGQIPQIGSMLAPMHLPVLLCGYVCGWPWGLAVGFIAPLLRSLIFGMPPMMPTAVAMAFELAAYGALTGLLYHLLPKKVPYLYLSLVLAMLGGRIVWGLVMAPLTLTGDGFSLQAFFMGAFVNAVPAIILQLVLIPPLVLALRRARVME